MFLENTNIDETDETSSILQVYRFPIQTFTEAFVYCQSIKMDLQIPQEIVLQ